MGILEALNVALKGIDIRDPLRSVICPSLLFVETANSIGLSIRINTIDRDGGHPITGLESRFQIPNTQAYWVARFIRDPSSLAKFVRKSLICTLEHEVDESLWVGSARAFDPQHWGS